MRTGTTLRRGRLPQGPVEPQRTRSDRETYADSMATLRRFGSFKGFEGRIEKILGRECLESVLHSSLGVHAFVPVLGLPASVRDGALVPRISGGGFTSLSDLIAEATSGGKRQQLRVQKQGVAAAAALASQHLWASTGIPAAGATASAAPGGRIPTNATLGALGQVDPGGTDTLHFIGCNPIATLVGAMLMYDRIFDVVVPETSTTTTVTGVPTRYTGSTAAGNWVSPNVTTVHTATAGNYTVTYTDEAGNTGNSSGAVAKRVSGAVQQIPLTAPTWNMPLASPDVGVRAITNVALSAAGASGATEWIIGHSLVTLPCPIAGLPLPVDGINSAFSLVQILSGAAVTFLEFFKSVTAANAFGIEDLVLVSG